MVVAMHHQNVIFSLQTQLIFQRDGTEMELMIQLLVLLWYLYFIEVQGIFCFEFSLSIWAKTRHETWILR